MLFPQNYLPQHKRLGEVSTTIFASATVIGLMFRELEKTLFYILWRLYKVKFLEFHSSVVLDMCIWLLEEESLDDVTTSACLNSNDAEAEERGEADILWRL